MRRTTAAVAAACLLLAACSATGSEPRSADRPREAKATRTAVEPDSAASRPTAGAPLRPGERFVTLAMPEAYTPKAPTTGTDDYRCFLLDPKLSKDAFVTGVDVVPGRRDLVHHVILFRVPPDRVAKAKAVDASAPGQGWTCFGGSGLVAGPDVSLDAAPWLGAWAPGGGERLLAGDVGIPLQAGSRVIMQVHYNLLAGSGADVSSARLRLAPGTARLAPLETVLLPAPVELPCRPGHHEPLCDRDKAVLDVMSRFGELSGEIVAGLQLLCSGVFAYPHASPVQHCDRTMHQRATVRAVAGHMHLLGRSIRITLNPGTSRARTLLDIPVWDFDEQGAVPLKPPAKVTPGDVLRVTCRHDQGLRDRLPAFKGQPERYVVWGEGSTDEMCLGIVLVTRP